MKKIITILISLALLAPAATALAKKSYRTHRNTECKYNVPWEKACRRKGPKEVKDYKEVREASVDKKRDANVAGVCRGHWSARGQNCR